ncbi:hypothetical protein QJQ45_022609, partial [Haematococcus lacustris]
QQPSSRPALWQQPSSSLAVAEFDPAAKMGMGLDPGAILAVSAASGMCDEDGCLASFYQAPRNSRRWNDNVKLELQHLAAATPAGTSLVAIQRHVAVTLATWDAVCGEYPHPKWAEQKVRLNGVQEKVLERYFKKLEEEAADISQQRCKQLVVFFGNVGIGVRGGSRAKAVLWACHKVVERPTSGMLTDRLPGKVVTVNEFCTSRVSSAMSTPQPCEDELDRSEPTRPRGGTGKEYQALGFKKLRYRAPAACSTGEAQDSLGRYSHNLVMDVPVPGRARHPMGIPSKRAKASRANGAQGQLQQQLREAAARQQQILMSAVAATCWGHKRPRSCLGRSAQQQLSMDQQELQGAQHQLGLDQQQLLGAEQQLALDQQQLHGAKRQLTMDQGQLQGAQHQLALDQQQLKRALQQLTLDQQQLKDGVAPMWSETACACVRHMGSKPQQCMCHGASTLSSIPMFGRVTLASDKKEDAECLRLLHARAPHIASAHMTLNVQLLKEYARECLGWKGKRLTQKKPLLRADILEHLRWEQEMEEDQLAESLLLDAMTEDTEASDIDWLSLPPELLGNIVARVCRLREHGRCMERRSLQQSCKALKQAVLLYWPQLTILLNKPSNPLNPPPLVSDNLVRKMQARQAKLEVVLWYQHQLCTKANADDCITEVLQSLPLCAAVERLSLQYDTDKRGPTSHLSWPDARTQLLRDCFPSLTALSVSGFLLWSDTLTGLVDASQQLGLHQLHVTRCKKAFRRIDFDDVFSGCRLQQLSLDIWWRAVQLPSLQQLAPHLTHLTLALPPRYESVQDCLPLLQGLSQLRVLNLTKPEPHPPPCNSSDEEYYEPSTEEEEEENQEYELRFSGLPQLVQSLPSLHSLHLPPLCLQDQDMEALLAITQLTHIKPLFQSQLSHSYADAACSWRHLELDDEFSSEHSALQTLAHLPLHSLTHPLHIPELLVDASRSNLDLATAAIENLVNRCKAPVSIGFLTLRCPTAPNAACTDGGVQLALVEALVAQLQPIAIRAMKAMGLHAVTPSTVMALAPGCRAASRVILQGGPMAPGLQVWLEMLRCMPAMTQHSHKLAASPAQLPWSPSQLAIATAQLPPATCSVAM